MRQRIAVGSMGLAAMLAFFVLWGATSPKSAIAEMAENIRRARSWKATMKSELELSSPGGEPAPMIKSVCTFYWLALGSVRMDSDDGGGRKRTEIYPVDKPGINIDHENKKFERQPARDGQFPPLMMLDKLGQFSGQADRELGEKAIDGKPARGFGIEMRRIDPDAYSGQAEIWVGTLDHLPVLLRYEFKDAGRPASLVFSDFQWNLELAPQLFDAAPPPGFADVTRDPPSLATQVSAISSALVIYRELSGGRYPRGKMVYGDQTRDEMYEMVGIRGRATPDQARSEKYRKIVDSGLGFAHLNAILRDNPDAAYRGQTVEPKDADKILLRWRLDDGRYQVIYGDLRAEILPAERLRELEGK